MKILDFLNPKAISADLKSKNKKEVIKELLDLLIASGAIKKNNKDGIFKSLLEREALGSTGIGQNIGIPHGKTVLTKKLVAAFGISKNGVNFDSLDGEPAHIFFLLLAPQDSAGPHLKALARISKLLKDRYFRDQLIAAASAKDIIKTIEKEDRSKH